MLTTVPRVTVTRGEPADRAAALVPFLAFLLAVAFSPSVSVPAWSPRAAIALVAAATGVPVLVWLSRGPVRAAAIAATSFVAIAALSTLMSDEPDLALTGAFGWGTGLLFVAALAGAWALGVTLSPLGRRRLEVALIGGFAVNVVVAVVQLAVDPGIAELRLFDDRATGLLGNPVHLAATSAAVFALVAVRVTQRAWPSALVAGAAGLGAQVAGSRFALAVMAVVAILAIVRRPGTGAAVLVAATVAGIVVGSVLSATGGGVSGTERVAEGVSGAGIHARAVTWWDARHAVARDPILGAGPGRFRAATSRDRSLDAARSHQPDQLYFDAHNVLVEYAVTTGLLGVVALAAWLVLAIAGTSGPLRWFALAMLAMHAVEPQMVGTTPVALLALGAARRQPVRLGATRWPHRAGVALAVPALLAGAALVAGDFHLDQARLDFDLGQARAARERLGWWAEPYELTARIEAFNSVDRRDPTALERSATWHERAVAHDPTSPFQRSELAEVELRLGDTEEAAAEFDRALTFDPWSVRALLGRARALGALGRTDEAIALVERALEAADLPAARSLLDELRAS